MLLKLNAAEQEALVDTLDQWIDEAAETERAFCQDKSIEDVEVFLEVHNSHVERTNTLKALRERLNAA